MPHSGISAPNGNALLRANDGEAEFGRNGFIIFLLFFEGRAAIFLSIRSSHLSHGGRAPPLRGGARPPWERRGRSRCGRCHFSAACQSPFNNSSALASSAFAMFRSTSNVKLYANLGASIALINERLIPAFFASSSCDSPRIFRHVEIITPSSFSGFSFPSVIPFPIFCRGKRMICFIRFLAHRF